MRNILFILLFFSYPVYSQVIISPYADSLKTPTGHQLNISSLERYYLKADSVTWDTVNCNWIDSTTYWVINKAAYKIRVKKSFTAADVFQFQLTPEDITFEPDDLVIDSATTFKPKNVTGYLKDSVTIRFSNCYAEGVHYEIRGIGGLRIQEIIEDSSALYGYIDSDNNPLLVGGNTKNTVEKDTLPHSVQIKFKLNKGKVKDWDSTKTKKDDIDLGLGKYKINKINSDKKSNAKYDIEKKGNKTYISKELSYIGTRLNTAVDITTITGEGATDGTNYNYLCTTDYLFMFKYATTNIERCFIGFTANQSAGTISSAVLRITNLNFADGSDCTAQILWGGQGASFATADYNKTGAYSYGQISATPGTYNITLNDSGKAYVEKRMTGNVMFAIKIQPDFDVSDGGTTGGYGSVMTVGRSSNATESYRPMLTINFGSSGSAPVVNKKPHIINMRSP